MISLVKLHESDHKYDPACKIYTQATNDSLPLSLLLILVISLGPGLSGGLLSSTLLPLCLVDLFLLPLLNDPRILALFRKSSK